MKCHGQTAGVTLLSRNIFCYLLFKGFKWSYYIVFSFGTDCLLEYAMIAILPESFSCLPNIIFFI